MRLRLLIASTALILGSAVLGGEITTFTSRVVADFELSLLGNTVINPGDQTPFLAYRAVGELTFQIDPSLNDPSNPTTVPFLSVTGVFEGVPPSPVLPFTLTPNLEFIGGELTNIVRDANGEVISADVSNLSMRWALTSPALPGPLYTIVGLPFSATIDSIPFSVGTVLAGAAEFEGYLDLGLGDSNPLVALGRNRTLTVVPEPPAIVSLAASGLALGALLGGSRRRRTVQA
ncbi:MAG: hypothetical protein U0790_01305 [Isosphaeraceae bacterium]